MQLLVIVQSSEFITRALLAQKLPLQWLRVSKQRFICESHFQDMHGVVKLYLHNSYSIFTPHTSLSTIHCIDSFLYLQDIDFTSL